MLLADSLSWLDKRFLDTFDSKAATNAGTEIHRVDMMDRMVHCCEVADCWSCESDQSLLEMRREMFSHEKLIECFYYVNFNKLTIFRSIWSRMIHVSISICGACAAEIRC